MFLANSVSALYRMVLSIPKVTFQFLHLLLQMFVPDLRNGNLGIQ